MKQGEEENTQQKSDEGEKRGIILNWERKWHEDKRWQESYHQDKWDNTNEKTRRQDDRKEQVRGRIKKVRRGEKEAKSEEVWKSSK